MPRRSYAKRWSDFVQNHDSVGGHWYKRRPIDLVFRRYERAQDLLDKYLKGPWNAWYAEAEAERYFFGVVRRTKREVSHALRLSPLDGTRTKRLLGRVAIHTVKRGASTACGDGESHDVRYVFDPPDVPLVCEEKDLPVLSVSKDKAVAKVAKSVLSGLVECPKRRQRLVAKWEAMCRRVGRIRQVIQGYELLIDNWLGKRHSDRYQWHEDTVVEVRVASTGRRHFFLWPRPGSGGNRSFKEVKVLREVVDEKE